MNTYKFKNKNNIENVLIILAKDIQEAKIYIANHNCLIFDEWGFDESITYQSPSGIKCNLPPYPYIIYTNYKF